MKREKENQIVLAKRRTWMISFSFGQLSFPLQYRSLRFQVYQISAENNCVTENALPHFIRTSAFTEFKRKVQGFIFVWTLFAYIYIIFR